MPSAKPQRTPGDTISKRARASSRVVRNDDFSDAIDPETLTQADFEAESLPGRDHITPLANYWAKEEGASTDDEKRIMYDPRPNEATPLTPSGHPMSQSTFTMRLAGPRNHLHFNPCTAVVGIVTCGGLCPGLNDVIRSVTLICLQRYCVKRVIGFRYGYWGMSSAGRDTAIDLSVESVRYIHTSGGTFLGTSRGNQKRKEMVDTLVHYGVNILFAIGGDGTQKGAETIASEVRERGLDIAVVGIPKTIDNDLSFSHRTFGYETAVSQAVLAVKAAHAEASSHEYGVGIVKVMGRQSGFIAAEATISSGVVNICLIPEMPISEGVVHELVMKRFEKSKFCVIVVAEGFGQNWVKADLGTDASGNKKLADIGVLLKELVEKWLKARPEFRGGTIKYIDPSYMIRACPPSSGDAAFCISLSNLAVHEAMAGTTNAIISSWYSNFVVVPIRLATSLRREVCVKGRLWRQVRELTVWLEEDTKKTKEKTMRDELEVLQRRMTQIQLYLSKL